MAGLSRELRLALAAVVLCLPTVVRANPPLCGNGIVDAGEQCDEGTNNGKPASCCKTNCMFINAGVVCRSVAGV